MSFITVELFYIGQLKSITDCHELEDVYLKHLEHETNLIFMFCLNEYFVTLIENAKYLHHHLFPSIAICIPYTTHRLLKQNEHLKLKVVERKSKGMEIKAEFMLLY